MESFKRNETQNLIGEEMDPNKVVLPGARRNSFYKQIYQDLYKTSLSTKSL